MWTVSGVGAGEQKSGAMKIGLAQNNVLREKALDDRPR